jgi:hypothetical protein
MSGTQRLDSILDLEQVVDFLNFYACSDDMYSTCKGWGWGGGGATEH